MLGIVFLGTCAVLWFGALFYIIVSAVRYPSEFKEAVNSILTDLLGV